MPTYGTEQAKDSVGKKFLGGLGDNSGTNEFDAIRGKNRGTQNSEAVVDLSVDITTAGGAGATIGTSSDAAETAGSTGTLSSKMRGVVTWLSRLIFVDGATFTAAASFGALFGAVYQSIGSVVEVATGKFGALRMTARRAMITATDNKNLSLTGATPVPAGSDVTNNAGAAVVSGDLNIRDTGLHYIAIPAAIAGWRRMSVVFNTSLTGALDQSLTVTVKGAISQGNRLVRLASFVLPASTLIGVGVGNGAVGQGGSAGGATAASLDWYNVPAIDAGFAYIVFEIQASSAPTTGGLQIFIMRGT